MLQEAADKSNPLIERLKFLGIFSNNQDEFFRVRVAALNRMIDLAKQTGEPQNENIATREIISARVSEMQDSLSTYYQEMGWDADTGQPLPATLERLGLGHIFKDLKV